MKDNLNNASQKDRLEAFLENEATPIPFGKTCNISDFTPERLSPHTFFSSATTCTNTPKKNLEDPSLCLPFCNLPDERVVTSSKYPVDYSANKYEQDMSLKSLNKLLKPDAAMEFLQLLASNSCSVPSPQSTSVTDLLKLFCSTADLQGLLSDNDLFKNYDIEGENGENVRQSFENEKNKNHSTLEDYEQYRLYDKKLNNFTPNSGFFDDKKKFYEPQYESQVTQKRSGLMKKLSSKSLNHSKYVKGQSDEGESEDNKQQWNGLNNQQNLLQTPLKSSVGVINFFMPDSFINLEIFRTIPCQNVSLVHNRKNCFYYHSQRDRRRHYSLYRAEQCEDNFDLDDDFICVCRNGDNCDKCHNRHELLYHPTIYKQRFCSSYNPKTNSAVPCHRGQLCAFAHSRTEIRSQLFSDATEKRPNATFFMLEFKTFWCPYGLQHDWHECLYAHTYQDCRRSPSIGYGSEPCPYWKKDLHCENYQKRCIYSVNCPYSHGSKEQLYHPAYYKTMPCADFKAKSSCPRGVLCAFYHDILEKRSVTTNQINNLVTSVSVTSNAADTTTDNESDSKQFSEVVYDYSKPLDSFKISNLQPNFMYPPLFNLDDFEAFGHTSAKHTNNRLPSNLSFNKNKGAKQVQKNNFRVNQYKPMISFYPDAENKNNAYYPDSYNYVYEYPM